MKTFPLSELNKVFKTSEVKQKYIDMQFNPYSSNYYISSKVKNGEIEKIQNGIYFKLGESILFDDLNSLFENNKEVEVITPKEANSYWVTNAVFSLTNIFVKSRYFENNKKLFKFIIDRKLAKIHIISSKWSTPPLKEYGKIYIVSFTNVEDDDHLKTAQNLIGNITSQNLNKIITDLKFNSAINGKIMDIWKNEK